MTEPQTPHGVFLRNGLEAMGYSEDDANETIVAIEQEARASTVPVGLKEAMAAIDIGVYPAGSPDGPRTPWQEGWNAADVAWGEAIEAALAATPSVPVGLDVELLARAIDVLLDVGRVQCRCGRWPLLDNWGNHVRSRSGRPHRPVSSQASTIIAREYARLAAAHLPVSDHE